MEKSIVLFRQMDDGGGCDELSICVSLPPRALVFLPLYLFLCVCASVSVSAWCFHESVVSKIHIQTSTNTYKMFSFAWQTFRRHPKKREKNVKKEGEGKIFQTQELNAEEKERKKCGLWAWKSFGLWILIPN